MMTVSNHLLQTFIQIHYTITNSSQWVRNASQLWEIKIPQRNNKAQFLHTCCPANNQQAICWFWVYIIVHTAKLRYIELW